LSFDLIVFDLDGTLVDSLPDIAGALNAALAAQGLAALGPEVVRGLVGEGVQRLADKALATLGAPADKGPTLAAEVARRYEQHPCEKSRLYPGVEATLAALRARGSRLAVLTNKLGGVARALLAALNVAGSFDAIIGDGDGYPRKPAPDAVHALLGRFGLSARAALMVGDGLPDLAVARAAGISSAGATWGYTDEPRLTAEHPTHLLRRPEDILGL
jgi:phosphoglycolate phosphatase